MSGINIRSLKRVQRRIVLGITALALILGMLGVYFNVARTASVPPGISTPTSLIITFKKAALQARLHGDYRYVISSKPASVDVISDTGKSTDLFNSGTAPFNTYNGVQIILDGTAKYSGINPCTGDMVSDVPVKLPGAVNNEYLMQYEVPHPVLGLLEGAKSYQSFKITADNRIDPLEFRVVFPVTDSIYCISDTPSTRIISGANTDINLSYSINLDSVNNEIVVSNNGSDSISFYRLMDNGNVLPLRVIQGASTELNKPWGVATYNDPIDPTNDELVVANSDDTITVYHRTDIGDTPPIRKIQGANSQLNGPGGIYIDSVHDQIGVANGGNNTSSITIYDRFADVNTDVTPLSVIQGPNTGLNTPCGISYDSTNDEIVVGNNGNNSITVYSRLDSTGTLNQGDVAPIRTIKGNKTGLINVCNLSVDPQNGEIAAVSNGANSITFFNRLANGNEYPIRTIIGPDVGLNAPSGLFIDTANDEIGVSNAGNNSIIIHPRADSTPHLTREPALVYPNIEQSLYATYVFSGDMDKVTGEPLVNNQNISWDTAAYGQPVARYRGYGVNWRVFNTEMRQVNDATNAILIPPENITFKLADGRSASTLLIGCASFTPFYLDVLTTNCKTQPPIVSPSPAVDDDYQVSATLLGKIIITKLHLNITSLDLPQLPRLKPHITMSGNNSILAVNWEYVDAHNTPIPAPIIRSQSFSINATQSFGLVSSCYQQVAGNALTLIYASGSLPPDLRTVSSVKNNNCDINMDDVDKISFTATDANGNQYVYSWSPT